MHLPQIIGNARAYELTSNATDAAIVRNFMAALTENHSYATGGLACADLKSTLSS